MSTETEVRCPKCGNADSITLDAGERLCLSCRNEWNPATVSYAPTETTHEHLVAVGQRAIVGAIMDAPDTAEVLAMFNDNDHADADVIPFVRGEESDAADWSDSFVRTDSNAVVLVLHDDGGGILTVQTAAGLSYDIVKSTATFIGDEPLAAGEGIDAIGIDEPMPQTILAVAGLCLTVALECVPDSADADQSVGNPRIGWLPPPCDQVPEAECGTAYAAALLISIFGLDREQVAKLAANLLTGAESGGETETEQ